MRPDSRADVAGHPTAAVAPVRKAGRRVRKVDGKPRLSCILSGKLESVRMAYSAPRSSSLFTIP